MSSTQKSDGKQQRHLRLAGIVVLFSVFGLLSSAVWACPFCKDTLASDPASAGRASVGYAVSIAALLGVPLLLIAGTAIAVSRSVRSRRQRRRRR